jgi:hypothetical protein
MDKNLIKTPLKSIAGAPKTQGSSGVYNGEPGYPKRSSSSGPPEKTLDNVPMGVPKSSTDRDYFKTY